MEYVLDFIKFFRKIEFTNYFLGNFYFLPFIVLGSVFIILLLHKTFKRLLFKSIDQKLATIHPVWNRIIVKYNLFTKFHTILLVASSYLLIHLIENFCLHFFVKIILFIKKGTLLYGSLSLASFIIALLNVFNEAYDTSFAGSYHNPIKSYVDVMKIITWSVTIILMISVIMNTSPLSILTGIGALGAFTVFILRDLLTGLITGMQISAYDILRIGDRIEIKNHQIDGQVIDIALSTIKIKANDQTTFILPTAKIMEYPIINWRRVYSLSARRIKKAIMIDVNSISLCSQEMLEKLKGYALFQDYTQKQKKDTDSFVIKLPNHEKSTVNNLQLFRHYILAYLSSREDIHTEKFTFLVRILELHQNVVPLEILVFCKKTSLMDFEEVQSEIFEHILVMLPIFRLKGVNSIMC